VTTKKLAHSSRGSIHLSRTPSSQLVFVSRKLAIVQASQYAAGIADGEDSGGKVAGDDAACADDGVLTDGDAGAYNGAAA
jgi:hypothetical protein